MHNPGQGGFLGHKSRSTASNVPGLRKGRGFHGWQPSPGKLRAGRVLEFTSLTLVATFALGAAFYLLALASGQELAPVKLFTQIVGGVSFLIAHLVPPIADGLTGGRARIGLWSVLVFWVTLAAFLGLPHL